MKKRPLSGLDKIVYPVGPGSKRKTADRPAVIAYQSLATPELIANQEFPAPTENRSDSAGDAPDSLSV